MQKAHFRVVSSISVTMDEKSIIKEMNACSVNLEVPDDTIASQWTDQQGRVNKLGVLVQTYGLVQGVLSNIFWGNKLGFISTQHHANYVSQLLNMGLQDQMNQMRGIE